MAKKKQAAPFNCVAIIGTGLIGTSIGLALKTKFPKLTIRGWDINTRHSRQARAMRALSVVAPSLTDALKGADLVILAAPLDAILTNVSLVLKTAASGSLVIDVGGVKTSVLNAARKTSAKNTRAFFVGGHPLAGLEHAGPEFARSDLFRNRPFALCIPKRSRNASVVRRALSFARSLGAEPIVIDAQLHDRIIAVTSGLPQLAATALSLAIGQLLARTRQAAKLVGPGYESTTRLAVSPYATWRAPLRENKRNLARALTVFEVQVRKLRRAIEKQSDLALSRYFEASASAKRHLRRR